MRLFKPSSHKAGLAPGTLVPDKDSIGRRPVYVSLVDYSRDVYYPEQTVDLLNITEQPPDCIRLVIVNGVHDTETMARIGEVFNLHPLILEDIVNTGHPMKLEKWEEHEFLILKTLFEHSKTAKATFNQVSLLVGEKQVIVFHEGRRVFLEPILKRLETGKGRIRKSSSGYLAYAIMDSIVDHYFHVLETMNSDIEELEDAIFNSPDRKLIQRIYQLKRQTMIIRRTIRPLQDIFNTLVRDDTDFFPASINLYLQDVQDHTILVLETLDSFRELLSSCLDSAMTADGNRMNEIMKVLTIIATIFIPLTFIAGIYGMNFEVMPELKWPWGYPTVLGGMMVILIGMVIWFRRRNWL